MNDKRNAEYQLTNNESYMHSLMLIAHKATSRASAIVRSQPPGQLTIKGDRDLTTEVDISVEQLVRNYLAEVTPNMGFLGEEQTDHNHINEFTWIFDPIDGTINFIHGQPLCAVSLSLTHNHNTIIAIIDLPFIGARYSALRSRGSYANGEQLHASTTKTLSEALVSIDQFTFGEHTESTNRTRLHLIEHLGKRVQRLRIHGTSALDLAWTAHGRLDACIILGNKPWDTNAGVLISFEAGAQVLDSDGSEHSVHSTATIAIAPNLQSDLMAAIQAAFSDASDMKL